METIDVRTIQLYMESDEKGRDLIERIFPSVKWWDLRTMLIRDLVMSIGDKVGDERVTSFQCGGGIYEVRVKVILAP